MLTDTLLTFQSKIAFSRREDKSTILWRINNTLRINNIKSNRYHVKEKMHCTKHCKKNTHVVPSSSFISDRNR